MVLDDAESLFGLASAGWILFWLAVTSTAGGVLGDSVPQIPMFMGITFLPPTLIYLLLFQVLPRIVRKFKKPATQT